MDFDLKFNFRSVNLESGEWHDSTIPNVKDSFSGFCLTLLESFLTSCGANQSSTEWWMRCTR